MGTWNTKLFALFALCINYIVLMEPEHSYTLPGLVDKDLINNDNTGIIGIAFAKEGFVEILELFVEDGVDLNARGANGETLLLFSAYAGRSRHELERLLNYGANWEVRDNSGFSIMHYAAAGGNLDALTLFRSLGANIESMSFSGLTPLLETCRASKNFVEMLNWFVEEGAELLYTNSRGANLLMLAAKSGKTVYELEHLIRLGLSWKSRDENGQTALHYAAAGGHLKALEYFKSLGANINAKDNYGATPLLRICKLEKNLANVLQWFAKEGAEMNVVNDEGNNLIFLAIEANRTKAELELLVQSGVNWKIQNAEGLTVLHYAAAYGNLEALKYFKSLGASINARDFSGLTPLLRIYEAEQNYEEMLTWFIKEKANLDAADNQGINLVFTMVLLEKPMEVLKEIVNVGVTWDVKNKYGQTVMHYAANAGNLEALKYFESLGADVDARSAAGMTPVLMTPLAEHNFFEILSWFDDKGADMHAVDNFGNNLVFFAVSAKRKGYEIVEILKYGVEWDIKSLEGDTIVDLAIAVGNVEAYNFFEALMKNSTNHDEL